MFHDARSSSRKDQSWCNRLKRFYIKWAVSENGKNMTSGHASRDSSPGRASRVPCKYCDVSRWTRDTDGHLLNNTHCWHSSLPIIHESYCFFTCKRLGAFYNRCYFATKTFTQMHILGGKGARCYQKYDSRRKNNQKMNIFHIGVVRERGWKNHGLKILDFGVSC